MKRAKDCDIAMIGLGTMGRNLALNMADHGFSVAGFDRRRPQGRRSWRPRGRARPSAGHGA